MIQHDHPPAPADAFILAFGDSLTAGYGLRRDDAFPAVLERGLQAKFAGASVHNAGVSGDTTSGGRARLPRVLAALPRTPNLAIVELGANDFIRGVDPARTADHLDAILAMLHDCRIPVLLAGMQAPAILGERARRFNAIYPTLATRHAVALDPFFLDGVAGRQGFVLADGFHPNAAGIAHVVARILPRVEAVLAEQVGRQELVGS